MDGIPCESLAPVFSETRAECLGRSQDILSSQEVVGHEDAQQGGD